MADPAGESAGQVILPPPEIKAIVDKTADFVAKHGTALEEKILSRERNVKKFEFLLPESPYHAYYKQRIVLGDDAGKPDAAAAAAAAKAKAARDAQAVAAEQASITKKAEVKQQRKRSTEKPPADEFVCKLPHGLNVSPQDIDVILLTAQFVARNGRSFLNSVLTREGRNPQFQFLRSDHLLFGFFTSLVESYVKVLNPSQQIHEKLQKAIDDPMDMLELALQKLDWRLKEEEEEAARQADKDREQELFNQIDWQDFTIVETITFNDGEDAGLPVPLTENELLALCNAPRPSQMLQSLQSGEEQGGNKAGANAGDGDADMDVDMDMDMDMEEDEAANAQPSKSSLNIVDNYQRPVGTKDTATEQYRIVGVDMQQAKRTAAAEDVNEHIRVGLIDPRWKEGKQNFQARQTEAPETAAVDVASNLSKMSRRRRDIFGDEGEETFEHDIKKIKETYDSSDNQGTVQWDGHKGSAKMLQQQANAMGSSSEHQQEEEKEPEGAAGPSAPPAMPQAAAPGSAVPGGGIGARPGYHPSLVKPSGTGASTAPIPLPQAGADVPLPQQPAGQGSAPAPPQQGVAAIPGHQPIAPGAVPIPGPPMSHGAVPIPAAPGAAPAPRNFVPSLVPPPGAAAATDQTVPVPSASGQAQATEPAVDGAAAEEDGAPSDPSAGSKRPREILPESDWAAQHSEPFEISVAVPSDPDRTGMQLNGQVLSITINVTEKISSMKKAITEQVGIPQNKQKFSMESVGILKDTSSFALYNIGPGAVVQLSLKERGGKKK